MKCMAAKLLRGSTPDPPVFISSLCSHSVLGPSLWNRPGPYLRASPPLFLIKKLRNHVNSMKRSRLSQKKSEETQDVTAMVTDCNQIDQTGVSTTDNRIDQTRRSQLHKQVHEAENTTANNRIDQAGMSQSNKQVHQARRSNCGDSANRLSATKTIQVLILFTFVTYMPYHILSIPWTYYKWEKGSDLLLALNVFYSLSCVVAMFNASGNACIIIYGNQRSRKFIASLLRKNRMVASS